MSIKQNPLTSIALMIVIHVSLYSCDHRADLSSVPHHSEEIVLTAFETSLASKDSELKQLAVMRVAGPLLKGLLQSGREGRALDLEVHHQIDHALEALDDHIVDAAVFLGDSSLGEIYTPRSEDIKLAESMLWWGTRGQQGPITLDQWRALISGEESTWPDGSPFILCRRASPDPLEELWISRYPKDRDRLEEGQRRGTWPSFESDEALISYLNAHPSAIALFAEGNLKYRGAPLRSLDLKGVSPLMVRLFLRTNGPSVEGSVTLKGLNSLLKSSERPRAVQEWGWLK